MRASDCAVLLVLCGAGGCTPVGVWLSEQHREPPAQVVVAVPDFHEPSEPLPPYAGPHPRQLAWRPDPADYPVRPGAVGPVDASFAPLQYPFACRTLDSRLGEPVVDNQQGWGTPVHENGTVIGYSKDCGVRSRIELLYKPRGRTRLRPYDPLDPADDVDTTSWKGQLRPFVLRVERGTINRFIYTIALLTDPHGSADAHLALWNRRLVYHFRGGVGIGKEQGRASVNTAVGGLLELLGAGYAVAFSTGTSTSTHYDLVRAGRTAAMVKAQFRAAYGDPERTIGVGASGGAVAQYLVSQNQPGLLDGIVPVYSYPDMVTQTNWALDCELLDHYFDITSDNPRWRDHKQRTLIMGLAASNEVRNPFSIMDRWARTRRLEPWRLPPGGTACAIAWRGLTALVNNPRYTSDFARYALPVLESERWSYWHDLRHVYGVDAHGFANRTWSNAGVQYGLEALRAGELAPEEFLHLNAAIGSWKPPHEMEGERYWILSGPLSDRRGLADVSIWSAHNIRTLAAGTLRVNDFAPGGRKPVQVAPRTRSDERAVAAAFHGGQVFSGRLEVPALDVRHYLDPELDRHHSFASLSARARIEAAGDAERHVIWMAEPGYDIIAPAVRIMDQWLSHGRPEAAEDSCFTADGALLHRGPMVWDGAWNGRPAGDCSRRFPPYRSPRNVAGEPMAGFIFRCALVDVAAFAAAGGYGGVDMVPYLHHLEEVFADGVCDYSLPERTANDGAMSPPDVLFRSFVKHLDYAQGGARTYGGTLVREGLSMSEATNSPPRGVR